MSDYYIQSGDKNWAERVAQKKDVLLILDELRMLHKPAQAEQGLLDLMGARRENNIDIFYIVLNPMLVLNLFTYYTHIYFIYFTNSKDGQFEKKIPNYTLAQAASTQINKYVYMYGEGDYPVFPYVVVDTKKKELYAVNMKKQYLTNRM